MTTTTTTATSPMAKAQRTTSSSFTVTTTAEKMTDTEEDDMPKDNSTAYFIAGLENDNLNLRTRITALERLLQEANEHQRVQQREIQRLREAIQTTNEMELFATTATGRTWHKSVNCHHLRGVRTRAMRPCTDCTRFG